MRMRLMVIGVCVMAGSAWAGAREDLAIIVPPTPFMAAGIDAQETWHTLRVDEEGRVIVSPQSNGPGLLSCDVRPYPCVRSITERGVVTARQVCIQTDLLEVKCQEYR